MDKTYSSIPKAESHLCRAWKQEFEANFLGQNYVKKEKKTSWTVTCAKRNMLAGDKEA